MYHWTTTACPECSSSTRSQPTTAWPRDSGTAAVALVVDRLQDRLQTMYYNAPSAYWACATVSSCLTAFRQSRVPAVDLVSDPPAQLSTPSRGAEPSSESAASLMLDLLHGTVFHTISTISVTLVFSSAASKLNYFVEHTSLAVSAPGRSVNSAIHVEMTVLLLLRLIIIT